MRGHSSVSRAAVVPALLALAFAAGASHASEDDAAAGGDQVSLAGRHALAVRLGGVALTTRNTISAGRVSSGTSSDVLAEISYSRWLAEDWSIGLSAGALVLGAETGTAVTAPPPTPGHVPGVVSFRSAAVTALLLNVGYHPARLSIGPSLRPYVSVGVGPYVGTGENVRVETGVTVESVSDSVLGARVLAGVDLLLGRRVKIGLSAGYHFVGDFDEPIRSFRGYSGPELSLGFGILLGGGR